MQISEAIDLIIALMEAPGKKDQIYLLMYEKDMAEVLYVLLTGPDYSAACKEKVLKVRLDHMRTKQLKKLTCDALGKFLRNGTDNGGEKCCVNYAGQMCLSQGLRTEDNRDNCLFALQLFSLLLKTDRVGAKSKTRLRIQEAGTYQGLVNMMMGSDVSLSMANYMLDLVLLTDTPASYNAALSIVQLLHGADQQIKLEATRRVSSKSDLVERLFQHCCVSALSKG